ncbi:MAG: peptidylprolyl isomerase [Pseudomonadota bacterium]|nr:peptidylprolyl isomerase [Pseudomonadota bacterium]
MFGFGQVSDTPAPPLDVPGDGPLHALLRTTMGDIEVELYEKEAPRTVANFVALAQGGLEWKTPTGEKTTAPLYKGVVFHRVIPQFMVQCGDPQGDGRGGPGWKWKDEKSALALKHDRPGILSMANAGPDTNGSQFFITEVPTPHLNGRHAVFGRVVKGLDLVSKITSVPRNQNDRPLTPVKLNEVVIYRGARAGV